MTDPALRWIDRLLLLGGGVVFGVVLTGCLLLARLIYTGRPHRRR